VVAKKSLRCSGWFLWGFCDVLGGCQGVAKEDVLGGCLEVSEMFWVVSRGLLRCSHKLPGGLLAEIFWFAKMSWVVARWFLLSSGTNDA